MNDLGAHLAIQDLKTAVAGAKQDSVDLADTVRDLEGRLDRQALVVRALFTLLVDKVGMTEQELLQRVREIAPSGGVFARPPVPAPRPCSKCGRTFGHKRNRCLFCGEEWEVASAFELI